MDATSALPPPRLNCKVEADRLKTFENWPITFMNRGILAAAGFIYTQRADTVRCVFCGVEIGRWEEGDDPFQDHKRWSPACPYIRRMPVGNIPLDPNNPSIVPLTDVHRSYNTCGPYGMQICPLSGLESGGVKSEDQTLEKLGIHISRGPVYPKFSTPDARIKSFTNWPLTIKQRPEKLSEAGFYSTGKGDQTVCFHCGGGLKDWEETDDPWVEHALWFSKCTYVVLKKGKDFVEKVCRDRAVIVSAKDAKNLQVPREFQDKLQIRDPVPPESKDKVERSRIRKMDATSALPPPRLNYQIEADRLKSFENWPITFMDRGILAAAGFVYTQSADTVRCVFCGAEIGEWVEGDDPFQEHKRWSPTCPYMLRMPISSILLDPSNPPIVPLTDVHSNYDSCGTYGMQICPLSGKESGGVKSQDQILEELGIHISRGPLHPEFGTPDARIKSYTNWPLSIKQRPEKLSEAGFYYTGKGDQTVCFHCGGFLKDWEETDDPWVEHALCFSKCTYVLLNKGKDFVEKVRGDRAAIVSAMDARNLQVPREFQDKLQIRDPVPPESKDKVERSSSSGVLPPSENGSADNSVSPNKKEFGKKKLDDSRLCKICYEEELGVVFLPCGHIVACVKCAPSFSTCTVCQEPFTATVRAYFS